ncbi:ExbD/TolR family protein [Brachymonas sp.]|uniref:ExbD/TolR family protein n=1 Tax=Brachymonas sp. TaxID=1936292 RepID=UPI0035B4E445
MSDINMTPLVDVMLVLVAILLITAPLLASRIALDLPQAQGTRQAAPDAAFVRISVQADGRLYLNDAEITEAALAASLRQTAQTRSATEVQLRADQTVPYGTVARIMGLAQQAGLSRIGFVAVQPAS